MPWRSGWGAPSGWLTLSLVLLGLFAVLLGVAAVCEVSGVTTLSRYLAGAVLGTTYGAVLLFGGMLAAQGFMQEIKVPTLIIHARNDPWILPGAYLSFDWKANPKLTPLLPRGGGHVGFHGTGSSVPWHDRCIADFLRRLG